jgi:hypothetical protein
MSQMTHECFADEIAIDFPSVGNVVDRMRTAFLGGHTDADVLRAEVSLSQREAFAGHVVALKVGADNLSKLRRPRRNVDRAVRSASALKVAVSAGTAGHGSTTRRRPPASPPKVARCVSVALSFSRDPFLGDLIGHHADQICNRHFEICISISPRGLPSVLFVVWGLLTVVVGLSTSRSILGGVLDRLGEPHRRTGGGGDHGRRVRATAFIAIVWGAAHILVGLPLKRRTPASSPGTDAELGRSPAAA